MAAAGPVDYSLRKALSREGRDIGVDAKREEACPGGRLFDNSQARLWRLYESMTRGVVFQDARGRIVSANAAAERILGLSLGQLQGRSSTDPRWRAMTEDGSALPGTEHPAMIAMRKGEPVLGTVMGIYRPDTDSLAWILVDAMPEFDEADSTKVSGVFTTFEDISERRAAREGLKKSEAKFRSFFENMIYGVAIHEIVLDAEGRPVDYVFLDANKAFGRLTGLDPASIIGRRVTETIPGIEATGLIDIYGKLALGGEPVVFEQYVEQLGRYYLVSAFGTDAGHFAAIFDDISARKKAESGLAGALEERKALFRELEHRVKNGLALIASLVDLESERAGEGAARDILDNTRDRISSLSELYAQLHKEGEGLEVRMDEYLGRVVDGIRGAYTRPGISLETDFERLSLPAAAAAPLGLIVNELVTNAIKYAFPSGREGRVAVVCRSEEKAVELVVSDDGLGMPRSEGREAGRVGGLGLLLVDLLAKQLGGESRRLDGEGTRIAVRIPADAGGTGGAPA
jgi:PAS domain S-box-containing protein